MQAAAAYLPPVPPNVEPDAPGPFAFAHQERVRTILAAAGFEAVNAAPHDEAVGSGSLESALALPRSEEHTSELPPLMRISYSAFCLKKHKKIYLQQYTKSPSCKT